MNLFLTWVCFSLPHFCEMQKGKGVCYSHICTPLTGITQLASTGEPWHRRERWSKFHTLASSWGPVATAALKGLFWLLKISMVMGWFKEETSQITWPLLCFRVLLLHNSLALHSFPCILVGLCVYKWDGVGGGGCQ